MSCDNALYVRIGTTWRFQFRFRNKETQVAQSLADLSARMQFRVSEGAATALLNLSDADSLTMEPDSETGLVTGFLTPAQTRMLAPSNRRTEVIYGLELFNDNVSPVDVPYSAAGKLVLSFEAVNE